MVNMGPHTRKLPESQVLQDGRPGVRDRVLVVQRKAVNRSEYRRTTSSSGMRQQNQPRSSDRNSTDEFSNHRRNRERSISRIATSRIQ